MKKKIALIISLSISVPVIFAAKGCISSKSAKTYIETEKVSSASSNTSTLNNSTILYTNAPATVYKKIGNEADTILRRWEEVKNLGTSGNYTYMEWRGNKYYMESKYLTNSIPNSTNKSKWVCSCNKLKGQLSKNTFAAMVYFFKQSYLNMDKPY